MLERRLRPVNSGSGILKTPLRVALGQDEAIRAIEELLPLQMGNGLKAGPQIKVYLARLLYEDGHFVSLQDAINAFNAMLRQAALDATKQMWPESTLLVNKIYGPKAACLYLHLDEDGNTHVACMLSEEGARMGCVLGGTIFNICMHIRVYRQMMIKYPMVVQRALTDDLTRFGKPVEESAEQWEATYTLEAEALLYYDSLANPIGIFRHPDKGKLLLPANAPNPSPGHPLLTLTTISRSAARVAGGFVGPDAPAELLTLARTETAIRRVHATIRMAPSNPQSATKVLAYAAQHTLDYLWGVTPTRLTTFAREHFQAAIRLAMDSILSPTAFDAPECHIARYTRAHKLLQLPTRFAEPV